MKCIPAECIINHQDIVPGIVDDCFPLPDKDPKKDFDTKLAKSLIATKTESLYIHHIEVVGSPKVEEAISKTLAQMFCNKKMSGVGMK